jgi:hypothetical protein
MNFWSAFCDTPRPRSRAIHWTQTRAWGRWSMTARPAGWIRNQRTASSRHKAACHFLADVLVGNADGAALIHRLDARVDFLFPCSVDFSARPWLIEIEEQSHKCEALVPRKAEDFLVSSSMSIAIGSPSRKVARPERFELPTLRFVAARSIQLSYGRVLVSKLR